MNEQPQQNDMTPEEAKASLGIATFLQEQMMPQAPMEQETQESAPEQEQKPEPQEAASDPRIDEMAGEFKQFKEDINKTIDDKISQIGEMIKQALKDDGQED